MNSKQRFLPSIIIDQLKLLSAASSGMYHSIGEEIKVSNFDDQSERDCLLEMQERFLKIDRLMEMAVEIIEPYEMGFGQDINTPMPLLGSSTKGIFK